LRREEATREKAKKKKSKAVNQNRVCLVVSVTQFERWGKHFAAHQPGGGHQPDRPLTIVLKIVSSSIHNHLLFLVWGYVFF
jgi:hypothetical protein